MYHDPPLRISDNDKLESLACDKDAERVECGLKMSVLMPDVISICFTQPATVNLVTVSCGFVKLTNDWEPWFFFISRLLFFLYSNLKLQPPTILYMMETHNSLTKGGSTPSP